MRLGLVGVLSMIAIVPSLGAAETTQTREFNGLVSSLAVEAPMISQQSYPISCGTPCNRNYDAWVVDGDPARITGIDVLLEWQNTQILSGDLHLFIAIVQQSDNPQKTFINIEGPSPISVHVDAAAIQAIAVLGDPECGAFGESCHLEAVVYAGTSNTGQAVDFGLAFQQTFRLTTTVTSS